MITTRQVVNENEVRDFSGEVFETEFLADNGGALNVLGGTVTGASVGFNNNRASSGGAIRSTETTNSGSTVSLDGATFTGNEALIQGGAYYGQSGAVFSVSNSEFKNNLSYMGGAISEGGSLTATGCTFVDNTAKSEAKPGQGEADYYGSGGAIEVQNGGSARISGSTFSGNVAAIDGGAVCKTGIGRGDVLEIVESVFSGNKSGAKNHDGELFGDGGAVAVKIHDATTDIRSSIFEDNWAQRCGGAIDNDTRSFLTVENSVFIGNNAELDGGALRNCGTASIKSGSTFSLNASKGDAGAVQNIRMDLGAGSDRNAVMDISDSVFTGNTSGYHGGAVTNGNNSDTGGALSVQGSTFTGNSSLAEGGAAANFGMCTVSGCNFMGNMSTASGGALMNFSSGSAFVSGSTFTGNTSGWTGGAFLSEGEVHIGNTLFENNRAAQLGGAVGIDNGAGVKAEVSDCTFKSNSANSAGGAVYHKNNGLLEISGTLFSGNTAYTGGALYNDAASECLVRNSTFTANTAGFGGAVRNNGTASFDDTAFLTVGDSIYNDGMANFLGDNVLNSKLEGGGTSYSGETTTLTGSGTVAQRYIAQGFTTTLDGVALDATMIGGKVDKAVGGVELNFNSVSMSADSLVFGAGECTDGDIDMAGKDVSLSFTGTGTQEKAYIYAGGHVDGDCAIIVGDVSVSCDVTGDMGAIWGGALLENGGSFVADEVTTEISGGRFLSYVGNGCKTVGGADGTVNTQITKTSLSITGGSFTNLVYAGGYSNGGGVTVGSSTLEISGGTFDKSVFGGNGANSNANGTNTTVTGDVSVTVDASDGNGISFRSNLYAGSMGEGVVVGTTTMTFKGNGENLSFSESSYVSGGSKLAYHYAYAQKTFVKDNDDRDARFLVFDGFSGDFGANMNNGFSNVSFVNGSSGIEFTGGSVDLRYTKVWDFEIGGDGTILDWKGGMNDFADDSLNISFDDGYALDSTPAVLLAGDAGTLNGWRKAEITLGGSAMTDADGDGIFTGSCGGVDYKLYEDDGNRLMLAIA